VCLTLVMSDIECYLKGLGIGYQYKNIILYSVKNTHKINALNQILLDFPKLLREHSASVKKN